MDKRIRTNTWVRIPLVGYQGHRFTAQAYVKRMYRLYGEVLLEVSLGGEEMTLHIDDAEHEPIENVYPPTW